MDTMLAYLNVGGLAAGVVGSCLTFYFGLPSLAVLNSGAYVEIEETPQMRRYSRLSRVGLGLIAAGFAMQLLRLYTRCRLGKEKP